RGALVADGADALRHRADGAGASGVARVAGALVATTRRSIPAPCTVAAGRARRLSLFHDRLADARRRRAEADVHADDDAGLGPLLRVRRRPPRPQGPAPRRVGGPATALRRLQGLGRLVLRSEPGGRDGCTFVRWVVLAGLRRTPSWHAHSSRPRRAA